MKVILLLACFCLAGSQVSLLGGFWAISRRRVRRHRRRMLLGMGLLILGLIVFWLPRVLLPVAYRGPYRGAYGLLVALQLGLGGASLTLAALAIWCTREGAWDLHRRAGMFAFMSGLFASVGGEVLAALIAWT